jgi:hypothetical protein
MSWRKIAARLEVPVSTVRDACAERVVEIEPVQAMEKNAVKLVA